MNPHQDEDFLEGQLLDNLFQWIIKIEDKNQEVLLKELSQWETLSENASLRQITEALDKGYVLKSSFRNTYLKKWRAIWDSLKSSRIIENSEEDKLRRLVQRIVEGKLQTPKLTILLPSLLKRTVDNTPPRRIKATQKRNDEKEIIHSIQQTSFTKNSELFIENAGLVILWPYLTRFFQSLELIEGKQFVSETAAHKSAILLQYLADGQLDTPEYLLVFNKILCGLSWDEVLTLCQGS